MRKNYLIIIQLVVLSVMAYLAFDYQTRNRIQIDAESQLQELSLKNIQFSFIVLDSKSIDSFYSITDDALKPTKRLNNELRKLRDNPKIIVDSSLIEFNAIKPMLITKTVMTTKLAQGILTNALVQNDSPEFKTACDFLFYYKCLPKSMQYLYPETTNAGLQLDALFLAHLRQKSPTLDSIIYGNINLYREHKIQFSRVFSDYFVHEVSAINAQRILIDLNNKIFDSPKHQASKRSFGYVLKKIIDKEWEMYLVDWD